MKFRNIFKRIRKNNIISEEEVLKKIADELISQQKLADVEKELHDYTDNYISSANCDTNIVTKLSDCEDLIQKLQTVQSGDIRTGLYNFLKKLNECGCLEEVVGKVINYNELQSAESNKSKNFRVSKYIQERRNERAGYWLYRYLIAFQNIKIDHDNDFVTDLDGKPVLSEVAAEKITVGLLKKWQKAAKKLPSAFSNVGLPPKTTPEEIASMGYDDNAKNLISSIVTALHFQTFNLKERNVKKAKSSSPYISLFNGRNVYDKMRSLSDNCFEADLLRTAINSNESYTNTVSQYYKKRRRVIRTRLVLAGLGLVSIFRLNASDSNKKVVSPKNTSVIEYETQTNAQTQPDIEILSVSGKDSSEQLITESETIQYEEPVTEAPKALETELLTEQTLTDYGVQDAQTANRESLESINQTLAYYEDLYEAQDAVEESVDIPENTTLLTENPVSTSYIEEEPQVIEGNYMDESVSAPQTIIVGSGDTLAKIAREQLGDESRYKEIAELNGLQNPDELTIGQVLTIPSSTIKSELEGYKEQLVTLKEQLPQSSIVLDNEMSIGDCFSTTNHTIYQDEYSLCHGENGRPSYFQGTLPDMVKSYVMTDGKDIIQVKTMEEAAALMDMGYTVKGYAALNPTSQNVADVEGFFRSENVKKLSL